jgi:hypothetical protein
MKSIFFAILLSVSAAGTQLPFKDTLCFTIGLTGDSNSLFGCGKSEEMRAVLAGPVIMDNNSLLFYSCNGYALFSTGGSLIDSHSVFKDNKKLSSTDPQRLTLAYPLDAKTIIYYRRNRRSGDSLEIYEKKIMKRGLLRISTSTYPNLTDIENSRLFNLAQNGFTDELASKAFLKSNLIGYSALTGGMNWWSLDRFYSFLSPLIVMRDKGFNSFYPGMLSDQKIEIQKHLINPGRPLRKSIKTSIAAIRPATCS